jgi:hypothetical protein
MKQKAKQSGGKQALSRITSEKKKIVIAVLLVGVMVIMWWRVLANKKETPVSTAVFAAQTAAAEEIAPKVKVSYVDLPQVKGRNDILVRDFFSGSKWEGLGVSANGVKQPKNGVKKSDNEQLGDTIEMIGKELKLEAIFSGKNPQASVSGALVSLGGGLTANYEGEQYEFKMVAINENAVTLECKGVRVKLSMARPTDSAD